MTPIYLGCLSTLTLFIPSNSLGTWRVFPSPARWCLGIQGLGRRLSSALHPVLVLVSANSWLFLPPDSSRWSVDVSFLLLPLLGGQSPCREAAGEREPHSSQTPVADAVQTHLTVLRRFFHQSWTAPCLCSLPSAYSSPCAIMDGLPQLHLLSFCSLLIVDPLISPMQNYPSACTWQPKLAFNIIPFSDLVYRIVPVGSWGSTSVEAANDSGGRQELLRLTLPLKPRYPLTTASVFSPKVMQERLAEQRTEVGLLRSRLPH